MKSSFVFFVVVLLLGAILWNGWVFGFVNHGGAGYTHMSISELEVVGQPDFHLFNAFEDISGVAMIVGSLGLLSLMRSRLGSYTLIMICIAGIGGLTIFDVSHPLDCNQYDNRICQIHDNSNALSQRNVLHNDESRITCYVTALLGLAVVFWAFREKVSNFALVSFAIIAIIVIASLLVLDVDSSVVADAIAERLWNFFLTVDIAYLAWAHLKFHKPIA